MMNLKPRHDRVNLRHYEPRFEPRRQQQHDGFKNPTILIQILHY